VPYSLRLRGQAEKDLKALPRDVRRRIHDRILLLREEPRPLDSKKLVGRDGYRVRVGDYRIIYLIRRDSREIVIWAVGHRKDVY
jgi:mRNA interferase RelE/StbE